MTKPNLRPRVAVLQFFAVFVLLLAAPAALATDYYADVSGGAWNASSTWHLLSNSGPAAPAGTFPGSAPGDRAIIDFQGVSITLSTTVPNPVTIDFNNVSCFLNVNAGGSLTLTGASQIAGGTILNLNGGTISNGGTLTIGSTSSIGWTSGTLTGSGATTINSGAVVNATGSSMILTGGQDLNLSGTFNYAAGASGFAVNSGAAVNILSGGTFDIKNSSGIPTDNVGNPTINVNSGGTFIKTADDFGTNIDPVLNNAGLVQTNINALVINDGTHSGTFHLNGPATGVALLNSPILNGATISGTGLAALDHTTINGTVNATNITFDGYGSLSGSGTLNLSGTFTWAGGSISGIVFNAQAGSAINVTGAAATALQTAAHLTNSGTMTINPGSAMAIISDAHITNNGTINLAGDVTITTDGAPLARIDNLATRSINKTAGASAAHVGVRVNNAGSVSSLSALLKLQGGGTHSGTFGLGTGAAIVFDGGTHQLNAGTGFSGSIGTVGLNAGVLDIDVPISLPSGIGFQQSGGVLTGAGNFTIPGTFLWTGGTMNNSSGNGQTVVTGSSSQIASTTSTITLSGRTLSNSGAFTYNPTPGIELSIDDGAFFVNSGTFTLVGDAEIDSNNNATPRFINAVGGSVNKTTGTGIADIYAYFQSDATINLSSGSIALHGGGQNLGTVNFGGATNKIIIANGTFSLSTAPSLNGGGTISVDGAFATLGIATAVTIPRLEILGGATVSGSTLTVSTSLLWRQGRMFGGVTSISVGATVDATSLTGTITLDSHSLTNAGTFNWNGATHSLQLINGSSLINNGTFTATAGGNILGTSPANAITNNGTFEKTGGTFGTRIDPAFANSGQLSSEVLGQSIIINGGGSQTGGGSLVTVAGAFIDFFGGTYTVPAGTSPFMGSGIFRVNGGTLAITASMFVPSPSTVRVDSGTLNVATGATFQIPAGLQWNGGTLAGDGTTRTTNGFLSNVAATTLNNNHTLSVAGGTFLYNGSSPNHLTIGGTANFNIEFGATVQMAANSLIAGTSTDGLTINGGILDSSAGLSTIGNGSMTGGTIALGLTGRVDVASGAFTMGSGSITGSGTIGVTGGTLAVNMNAVFPNLVLSAGTLTGTGVLTVNGGSWSGGTMSGTGSTTIAGPFTIDTGSVKTLARNLTNNSTVTENDGFTFTGTAVVTNNAGIWHSMANTPMVCSGCSGRFHNAGTYNKGANFVTHTVKFDNDAQFTINAGAQGLSLGAGGTHTGDFNTATGNLHLGGSHTFSSTSDMTGSGNVQVLGTTVHSGTIVLGDSTVNSLGVAVGGTATLNTIAPVQAPRVTIFGTMDGSGAIQINGPGTSTINSGGTLNGTGVTPVDIASGATFVAGASTPNINGRKITNAGTFIMNGDIGGSGWELVNNGTFRGQPAGAASLYAIVRNHGTAEFLSGGVSFLNVYEQAAGTTILNGGNIGSPFDMFFNAGSLTGTGSVGGHGVYHAGVIAPGFSPGAITFNAPLTLAPTSVVNIEIGGTTPATQYDRLIVANSVDLDGTLNVTFIGGFVPADNDIFDVVTWNARTGTFAAVNLPPFVGGTLTGTYEPNAFRITTDTVGDLAINKTGPATAAFGANVTFTITVTNNGPSAANGVIVNDPTPANLTFVSNSGDCTTAFPCSLGTIPSGVTKTISATYTVSGGAGTNITNTADVVTTTTDNAAANNVDSHSVFVELADLAISKMGPASAQPFEEITFTINVANGGASNANDVVVNDPTPAGLTFIANSGACTTPFPCALGTVGSGVTKTIQAKYFITAAAAGTNVTNTATVTTSTSDDTTNNTSSATVNIGCRNEDPRSLSPSSTAGANGTLSWRGRGDSYVVYFGPEGSGCSTKFATTTGTSVPYSDLTPGQTYEWRAESIVAGCRTETSACVKFTVPVDCTVPAAPVARVVGQATSAKTYSVEWDAVEGATHYAIDEATNPDFNGATRLTVNGTSQAFKHDATTEPIAFYYRVFAFTGCIATPGPASTTVRVVIIPLPPKDQQNPSINVPAGSQEIIVQEVFIPGQPNQNLLFTAKTDRPWLTVRPEQGVLTPSGINLEVLADPKTLPNGTFTASVIVTITDGTSGTVRTHGVTTVTTPISVNLVTPVTPVAQKPAASQHALIIPSAGHLGGVDSHWQSDIRVTNAGFRSARYKLTFTPAGGSAQGVKETTITVDAGATTALDDIIRNWYGFGTLGDGVNGMLEILPLDDPATTIQSTVASSRTYNVSGNGTLGQYIPAIPFPNFIGRPASSSARPPVLSLQQIAQNASYRTNVGLAEASGQPVTALMKVFSSSGVQLAEIPVSLAAGEQRQMNAVLATHGIELADGRIEVQVTSGEGKITAYASVVDSNSQDPLLVSGQPLTTTGATKYVLPGVANLDNQLASWRTDMRVFNYGTTSQPATLVFYPFNNGEPKSASVLLGAGQVMTLDNVLRTQFDVENQGGVIHLNTANAASLVVTGRTYNQTSEGTYGQFVPAVTVNQAVGAGERTLHILQVEDSTRYRTNIGLAEVNGQAATVELQVVLPDSKITPTVEIPLAANEFRQFNVIRELGLGNVYNARVTIRVKGGSGRVTAYGSVIDETTQDPTYVPAQ